MKLLKENIIEMVAVLFLYIALPLIIQIVFGRGDLKAVVVIGFFEYLVVIPITNIILGIIYGCKKKNLFIILSLIALCCICMFFFYYVSGFAGAVWIAILFPLGVYMLGYFIGRFFL